MNLGAVISSCTEQKLLNKLIKSFEKESGMKVRKVNKTQSLLIWQLICSNTYWNELFGGTEKRNLNLK